MEEERCTLEEMYTHPGHPPSFCVPLAGEEATFIAPKRSGKEYLSP